MADTTFVSGTVITKEWLNDVNDLVYGIQDPSTGKGASLVSIDSTGTFNATNVEEALRELQVELARAKGYNILQDIPPAEWPAIFDGTTTYDVSAIVRTRASSLGTNGTIYFPGKKYTFSTPDGGAVISSYIRVSNRGFTIVCDPSTTLSFTDAASVAGIYVDVNGSNFRLYNGNLWGTNTTTPQIELLRVSAPYSIVAYAGFAYASIAINYLGVAGTGVYITKTIANQFSNCDQYIKVSGSGIADVHFIGNTYGTTTQGSNPSVEISSPGCIFVNEYFETMSHTAKPAFRANTGTVAFMLQGKFYDSGEILVQNSVRARLEIQADSCYSTTNSRFIRVDGGGTVDLTGSELYGNGSTGGIFGISASGVVVMGSGTVKNYQTGIGFSGILSIGNTLLLGNGTALSAGGSSSGASCGTVFSGNTTDVSISTGSTFYVDRKESSTASPGAGSAFTPNVGNYGQLVVTMPAGNITVNSPSNSYINAKLTLIFIQDATGGRTITWNSVFSKPADGAGGASQRGSITFTFDGTYWVAMNQLTYA